MSPIDWAIRPLKKYADFTGRSPRAEYWWFMLLTMAASVLVMTLESSFEVAPLFGALTLPSLIVTFVTFVPTCSVLVRRLHDTDRSAYLALPFFVLQFVMIVASAFAIEDMDVEAMSMGGLALLIGLFLLYAIIGILLLVFSITEGTKGDNRFGPDPYEGDRALAAA